MSKGIVNKYSEDKEFGYIIKDDGKEVFVERSSIDIPGYKTLVPGERVTFKVEESARGIKAKNVRKV